ncbi:MAG: hypothetical protein KGH49_00655, partial [Candidatus Micrarchaeota archaeon]|nr:hypothetical protein [Candidatus Micrarchaeota archaeon]
MRAQASLEFILVLSAISVLCLAMVAAYNGNASSLKQSFGNALNTSNVEAPAEPGIAQKPGVFFYVPQNSTTLKANKMQIAAMGCQNGTMTAHFISPEVLFSQNSLKMSESGLNIASLYFTPLSQGYNQVEVLYNSTCGNDTKSYSSNFTTYSAISGGQGNPVSADITNRSEYFLYKIFSGGNIFGINEFSHCTVRGMGDPLPISAQCGADSWGYSVFSDYCYTESNYYTMTYCIEPVGTNYSTAYINPSNYSLKYSLGLGIYYEGQSLSSNLSGNTASPLLIANRSVGYSKVLSATGVDSPPYANFVAFKTDQMSVSGQ